MRVAAHDAIGFRRVHVRIVEQAEEKLPAQHGLDHFVEFRFLQHALAHQLGQMQVAIRLRQFDVDAGPHRQGARFLLILGDEMPMRVGTVAELPDRVVIGYHEAFETPLLAQNIAHQPAVGV